MFCELPYEMKHYMLAQRRSWCKQKEAWRWIEATLHWGIGGLGKQRNGNEFFDEIQLQ